MPEKKRATGVRKGRSRKTGKRRAKKRKRRLMAVKGFPRAEWTKEAKVIKIPGPVYDRLIGLKESPWEPIYNVLNRLMDFWEEHHPREEEPHGQGGVVEGV